ncbi:Tab2/Atab2 family RNA-binding protein [Synechococcus bigranulatus str. 'Rupite']|uniref:Tab2/Atab2 family RNA-binding protein n=2 Tax=Thermostichus vulcanus TaxID=32053 RepID=A0ABT0C7L6_THEVL|nr:Tab2/Atab2 family RNA-binding protein [Thermostichus vulcanus str. 'Rupite']
MDFTAVPLRDEQDRRVWELLVCDPSGQFRQAQYCSNQEVNSTWVAQQLRHYLEIAPQPPSAIRVFRARMSSILQRACDAVGIPMLPSRRVYTLNAWMRERAEQVYPNETQFRYCPEPLVEPEPPDPARLPDKLQGERWALVTLRAADLQEAESWPTEFGELFPVAWDTLAPDTIIPGLVITSRRALPMAAWMTGLEPAYLSVVQEQLILEAGLNDRYLFAPLKAEKLRAEAEGFAKRQHLAQGIHFLAIQTDLKAQSFAGFWLMQHP